MSICWGGGGQWMDVVGESTGERGGGAVESDHIMGGALFWCTSYIQ